MRWDHSNNCSGLKDYVVDVLAAGVSLCGALRSISLGPTTQSVHIVWEEALVAHYGSIEVDDFVCCLVGIYYETGHSVPLSYLLLLSRTPAKN